MRRLVAFSPFVVGLFEWILLGPVHDVDESIRNDHRRAQQIILPQNLARRVVIRFDGSLVDFPIHAAPVVTFRRTHRLPVLPRGDDNNPISRPNDAGDVGGGQFAHCLSRSNVDRQHLSVLACQI